LVAHVEGGMSLMVFEIRVKRDEVTGKWRKLQKEDINDLYFSPNVIWVIKSTRMRRAVHVSCMGGRVYRVVVGKPKGMRPLGRPKFRWEDDNVLGLQEVGWGT